MKRPRHPKFTYRWKVGNDAVKAAKLAAYEDKLRLWEKEQAAKRARNVEARKARAAATAAHRLELAEIRRERRRQERQERQAAEQLAATLTAAQRKERRAAKAAAKNAIRLQTIEARERSKQEAKEQEAIEWQKAKDELIERLRVDTSAGSSLPLCPGCGETFEARDRYRLPEVAALGSWAGLPCCSHGCLALATLLGGIDEPLMRPGKAANTALGHEWTRLVGRMKKNRLMRETKEESTAIAASLSPTALVLTRSQRVILRGRAEQLMWLARLLAGIAGEVEEEGRKKRGRPRKT